MGPWETAIDFLYKTGFFALITALLVFTLLYFLLFNWLRKARKREPKKYEKALFLIISIFIASLIFIFSVGEAAAVVMTYITAAVFVVVMFFFVMILLLSFFGKPTWKFWKVAPESIFYKPDA
jgi:membrane-associated HD superfamily phosphohydrolase